MGWQWAGDPDRGFGAGQPGGWHYNILPFCEYKALHDLGKGAAQAVKRKQGLEQSKTTVSTFICPTRHPSASFLRNHPTPFVNIEDPMPRLIGKSDYAANAGSLYTAGVGDGNANYPPNPSFKWSNEPGSLYSTVERSNGVIVRAGGLPLNKITDGTSKTYLIGERYLETQCYLSNDCCDNDQGWDMGWDYDTNRGTLEAPARDQAGSGDCSINFGSAHPGGFNMGFCDGNVRTMRYDIDPAVHKSLGARNDGKPTDNSWAKD
jgi:prepilin-type processing-associated H-X9-DG protein